MGHVSGQNRVDGRIANALVALIHWICVRFRYAWGSTQEFPPAQTNWPVRRRTWRFRRWHEAASNGRRLLEFEQRPSVHRPLLRRKRDSNPRTSRPVNGFQDRRFQPLTHSSVILIIAIRPARVPAAAASTLSFRSRNARMTSSCSTCFGGRQLALNVERAARFEHAALYLFQAVEALAVQYGHQFGLASAAPWPAPS